MASKSNKKAMQVSQKSLELAIAVPQVIAQRLTRMAFAGPDPSARDKKEFFGMVEEKQKAFTESWLEMSAHAVTSNQAMAVSFFEAMMWPKGGYVKASQQLSEQMQDAGMEMLSKGLTPVHKKAVSNAKRLSKANH